MSMSRFQHPHVVAVIVSWNSRDDVLACLASLGRSEPAPPAVILVDNGSADGTVAAVRQAFPDVSVIAHPTNLHFARGANAGLRAGLERRPDYLWLLNPDVTVAPGALAEMIRVAESDPAVGVVGARLVHPGRAPRVVVGAGCDFRTGAIVEPDPPPGPDLDRLEVDYVWGCAMLIRAETARQVGLLDEGYVAYFEDADFCLRARRAGWRTATALRAVVHHFGSKSANRVFVRQMWLRGRNWLRCYWRHAPPSDRPRLLAWMVGYRLPHLAWSALVTIAARTLRPKGRPIRLWS
jgi:hypothetical protein